MNLVDSCGWLEYFADGPNAGFFAPAIEDADNLLVPTICILEVFKRILQQRGEGAALRAVAAMHSGHVAPLDAAIALSAARLGVDLGLPMADSVIVATGWTHRARVWTQDADLEGIDGVEYRRKG